VKELLKSVDICQGYCKNKSGTFFMDHGVISCVTYEPKIAEVGRQKTKILDHIAIIITDRIYKMF